MRRASMILAALLATLAYAAPGHANQPRIVGGNDAPAGQFPYVANISIQAGVGVFGCTGSLIAPTWVLTAGHCVSITGGNGVPTPLTFPAAAYAVTVGTENQDGTGGEHLQVKSVHLNPNYTLQNGMGSDVGLLELTAPATVAPIKIAAESERSLWEPGDLMTIVGFGTTTTDGDTPDRLQSAQVPIVSDADCTAAYSDKTPVLGDAFDPKTAVCAGYPEGGTDTCSGDSGGPLLAPTGDTFRLVGSTSYGEGCALPGKPGVYARLAEGSVKTFISGLVPDAYATPGSEPAPPAPTTCKGVTYQLKGRFARAAMFVDGQRVVLRHKPSKVRMGRFLAPTRTTRVRVVRVAANGHRRVKVLTFAGCARTTT